MAPPVATRQRSEPGWPGAAVLGGARVELDGGGGRVVGAAVVVAGATVVAGTVVVTAAVVVDGDGRSAPSDPPEQAASTTIEGDGEQEQRREATSGRHRTRLEAGGAAGAIGRATPSLVRPLRGP